MSILKRSSYEYLNGWADYDFTLSLETFQRSAREIIATGHGFKRDDVSFSGARGDWLTACQAALNTTNGKSFFESHFDVFEVSDSTRPQGLFTGYYEPEAEGAREPSEEFQVPIYRRPSDLVAFSAAQEQQTAFKYGRIIDGVAQPYPIRREIEQGFLKGKGLEIAYIKDWADAFFMHIQGSGRVRLKDGSSIRLAYALKTGHPYTGIGGVLVEKGVLTKENNSMQSIRAWMKLNPAEARELMWRNNSFIFFREVEVKDEALGAVGAQQVNLTPLRSLAVDRLNWSFGTPIWLTTNYPPEAPLNNATFQNLMIAQDTGSAIKGHVRGDIYWGWGHDAAQIAGHMKSPGAMYVLLPKPVARALKL